MKNWLPLIVLLYGFICIGQNVQNAYQFKHLNTSNGLSQSSVIAIEQDNLGRMWLGTRDGLNLYDGTGFKVYRTRLKDSTSISNSDILSIKQDKEGDIWIGTYNGLNKYDPISDSFKRYYHFNEKTSLSNNTIWALSEQANGTIWIGTSNGLSIYNKDNDSFVNFYKKDANDEGGLPSNYILSIEQANNGTTWIGTSEGFCKALYNKDKAVVFKTYKPAGFEKNLFVQTITACDENTLCVGTKNNGLFKFDLISERFLPRAILNTDQDIRAVTAAANGLLWVGSSEGIAIVANNNLVEHIKYEPNEENSLSHNYVKSVFRDKKGSIWVGSYYGGVDIWDASNANFLNFKESSGKKRLSHKVVSSIVDDASGNLYLGTEGGGLTIMDKKTNGVRYINTDNAKALRSNNIKSLLLKDHTLWIGTFNKGVKMYNTQTNRFIADALPPELSDLLANSGIYTIKKGVHDDIWFGTFGQGLIKYNVKEKSHVFYKDKVEESKGLTSNRIRSLMTDKGSNIWVGTQGGLNLLPYSNGGYPTDRLIRFFYDDETDSGDDILTIFQDTRGTIWVGIRAKGLFRFDGNKFIQVKIKNTREITSIYAILEDTNSNLWMSSNQGIIKYNIIDGSFVVYTEKDGLVGNEFSSDAALKQGNSKFYFGGPEGVSYFDSKTILSNDFNPQVVLTNLNIKNEAVLVSDDGILTKSMPFTREIVLDYDNANFSIDFTMPNFINPDSNQYQYRMVGLEDNWTMTDQTRANYTIQRPGNYVFEVRGANNDKLWNAAPTKLEITVHPAPWFSNWAYTLYVLIAIGTVLGLVNMIRSKTKLRHKLQLEHLENERNQDINDAKLRFFTNVSHEFRTPLTLITGPLQQLLTDYKGSSVVYKKLLVIESNANHLLQLINRLMDFRKLEHKKYALESAEGNLIKFLREIFLSFSEFAKGNGYDYTFETDEEQVLVYYDRPKLEQVFYNLISNAFKYTPAGGTIAIHVRKKESHVVIDVLDSGPGIPMEYKNKVFERFFEIPDYVAGDNPQNAGTGIGLSIAKSIIDLHKGEISVLNDTEVGSTFRVSLKLGRDHINDSEIIEDFKFSDDVELYASQLSKTQNTDVVVSPEQLIMDKDKDLVLVVEDNVPLRNFIKDILKDAYNVIEAGDGKEGLKQAIKYVPSLIVSDVIMPIMVGTEFCAKIKENIKTSHIPVILLTSRTSLLYKFEGLESGADDYISKPFNVKEFRLRIKNLIDSTNRLRAKFGDTQGFTPNEIVISSIDEQLLKKALQIVEDNISNSQFDIVTFSMELGVSRTLLFTKIKAWTNCTPNEFIQEIRMKRAVQLLEQGNLNISEIGYQVGFKNPKYFSKCFHKKFGLSPTAYIDKFSEKHFDLN